MNSPLPSVPAASERVRGAHIALLGQANSIHLQRWAIGLAGRGLRISVITQQGLEALAYPAPIDLHVLPHRGAPGYFFNAWALRRLLATLRPDLLHAHYASGYGTTAMLSGWQPLMLSVWGADVYDFPKQGLLQRRLLLRNLETPRLLASTSQAMAAQVRRLWPGAGPIAITPFGVDTALFAPEPARAVPPAQSPTQPRAQWPTEWPLAQPLVIGTVKSLTPKYGIDVLIRAFARLQATLPPPGASLLIVGDGPERATLEQLAAGLGLAEQVRFAGAVAHDTVPSWLRRMHIYVAASRDDSESFGVAVIEASACALPVVVSDAGGLPEVVQQGRTGFVVPREDDRALAAALAELAASAPLRQRLGRAGRERVLERYDWARSVDTMLDCYAALLGRPVAGRRPPMRR